MTYLTYNVPVFQPAALGGTSHVSPLVCSSCHRILLFGFFYKNRGTKRTRRPESNTAPAHADRQRHSDRFRLRKQHLGRAARWWQCETFDEFSGTDREPTLLT